MGPSCNIGCGFLNRWTRRGRTTIDPRAIQPRLPPAYRKRFSLSTRLHKLSKSRYPSPCPPNIPGQLCQIAPRPDSATNQRRSRQNITVRKRQPHKPELHVKQRTWMRWSASVAFECFSQRMCLTLTAVAAFIPLPYSAPGPGPLQISTEQNEERFQYVRTFPPLSAVSSAFPLPFSPLFLSLEVAPFAISNLVCRDRYRVWAVGTNRIDGIYTDQRHVGRTLIWKVRARWTGSRDQ
jgi:hypothetical protein